MRRKLGGEQEEEEEEEEKSDQGVREVDDHLDHGGVAALGRFDQLGGRQRMRGIEACGRCWWFA